MTKIFHFHDPHDARFASAGRRGTWYPDPSPGLCPECGSSQQKRIPPLILVWHPDSDQIGDFVWPGMDDEIVVTDAVRTVLEGQFQEFQFEPLLMWQDPKIKRPQRITKHTKARVWLPYEGPTLWDLQVISWCHLDLESSGEKLDKECSTCRTKFYKGPPFDKRHLVVDPTSWKGADVFHIYEYPRWLFCTERVKTVIEQSEFTNVSFLEDGKIPNE